MAVAIALAKFKADPMQKSSDVACCSFSIRGTLLTRVLAPFESELDRGTP